MIRRKKQCSSSPPKDMLKAECRIRFRRQKDTHHILQHARTQTITGREKRMDELITKRQAINALIRFFGKTDAFQAYPGMKRCIREVIGKLKSKQPKIIFCKDCIKHNIALGEYEERAGKRRWYYKGEACPLVEYRGKAHGHEFDYQYCAYGKRKGNK